MTEVYLCIRIWGGYDGIQYKYLYVWIYFWDYVEYSVAFTKSKSFKRILQWVHNIHDIHMYINRVK